MRISSLFPSVSTDCSSNLGRLCVLALLALPLAQATRFNPVPSPNLDLDPLGRITLTGNFDAISLYLYEQQKDGANAAFNGSQSQSLIAPLPNGGLIPVTSGDADIFAMCTLTKSDGNITGIVVGGNFTSFGGTESAALAHFDPVSGKVSAISGLSGKVYALLCDEKSESVYVGGDFKASNTSNAILWSKNSGISSLPFGGFNKPVNSIVKTPDGHIVFGGDFDGLGNTTTPSLRDQQVVNLGTAKISSSGSTTTRQESDPENVVCRDNRNGSTWLLEDNSPGFWRADMNFGFRPTKLRIRNTRVDGRGTKNFRFTALPDTGILNMTYVDPKTGDTVACESRCPLSDDSAEEFRDFRFVNVVGMKGFQLDISEWYGSGGGLDGVELFQDDIYTYAVQDFNEPRCGGVSSGSKATKSGDWTVMPAGQSPADYLGAKVDSSKASSTSVTFFPDIRQSGNYSVTIFTPGCIGDGTCGSRGIANVTGKFSTQSDKPTQTLVHETNNFDKYDQIYLGRIDSNSDGFRAEVKVTAQKGQGEIDLVASRIKFELISSTGGLNGLFEYDPDEKKVSTNFTKSAINRAGMELDRGASVKSLVYTDDTLVVGGNFSNGTTQNIMSLTKDSVSEFPGEGLNSAVTSLLLLDDVLYVGGEFSDTAKRDNDKLSHVAAYSISDKKWASLGSGVNGNIQSLVRFPVNISSDKMETCIAVNGDFNKIKKTKDSEAIEAEGFAVWVPSKKKWLSELSINQMAYVGRLTASIIKDNDTLLAGNLASGGVSSHGAVALTENDELELQPLPIKIQQDTDNESSKRKRAVNKDEIQGVTTGIFDKESGRNLTVLAGHFSAKAANGSTIDNVVLINGEDNDAVTGLGSGIDSDSEFLSLAIQEDLLFLGGKVEGRIASSKVVGLVVYDLAKKKYSSKQPAALSGDDIAVNSIAPRPGTKEVYVGGHFGSAGSLPCPNVCNYQVDSEQWNRPGGGLQGTVSVLKWSSKQKLVAAGNLTVSGNQTLAATYDTEAQTWSSINGAPSNLVSGSVTAFGFSTEDGSNFWVAGKSPKGTPYLVFYDGKKFRSVGSIFGDQTTIKGAQILRLQEEHEQNDFLEKGQTLLLTGQIQLPKFGIVSGALYNGTVLSPFILSSTADGQPGSINGIFTENQVKLSGERHGLARGLVVLISFCIALGCIFLIMVIGIILGRIRRQRQGYVQAPKGTDRKPDLNRLPPEYLLDSLRHRRAPGVPRI